MSRWTPRRRRVAAAAAAGALLLSATACSSSAAPSDEPKTLTLAMSGEGLGFDPADAQPGFFEQYLQPLYDPLVRLDEAGEPTPNLATSFEYDESLTTLTLDLRTDVTFSDGTTLDAAAVKTGLEHNKAGTSTSASQLGGIESIEATDADTVTITLTAPDPSLLANLGSSAGMIASPDAIAAGDLATNPVGSGPYVLDAATTTTGDQYGFVRSEDYWNVEDYPFDSVVLKIIADPTAVLNGLRSGQINGGPITAKDAAAAGNLNVINYPNGDLEAVYFYDKAGLITPALADVRVRQAINMALDRDALVQAGSLGLGTPTTQMFSINADNGIYDEALNDAYPYDPDAARELLAEAGYPDGFDVVMPDWSAYAPEVNLAINQALADIGIRVTLDAAQPPDLYANTLQGKYAMGWQPYDDNRPWDLTQYQLGVDSPWNPLHYEDPTVTDLISQIQLSAGDEQLQHFRELNEYLVDQAWAAPLTPTVFTYATTADVIATPQAYSKRPPLYDYRPAQ